MEHAVLVVWSLRIADAGIWIESGKVASLVVGSLAYQPGNDPVVEWRLGALLTPGTPAYGWYADYHRKHRLGTLGADFTAIIGTWGRDDEYHEVARRQWALTVQKARDGEISGINSPDITLDTLLDFERESIFISDHDVFKRKLERMLGDKATIRQLWRRVKAETDINHQSLVGLWWSRLSEGAKQNHRVMRFT